MLSFEDQVFLIETRGLPAAAVRHLALDEAAGVAAGRLADQVERQRLLAALGGLGLRPRGPVAFPCREETRNLIRQLRRADARLLWRGRDGYPSRLEARLGNDAPHWAWLAGPRERLEGPACAFVGSRQASEPFLKAARRLARALAGEGVVIASGLAEGADRAAHAGALEGHAKGGQGTLAVPARGLLRVDLGPCAGPAAGMSCLALDRPWSRFSPGLAIRRNTVIAAMSHGLVLVASGLKGGSCYAVQWALRHRLPIWCFEAGSDTPPGNRALIRGGQAEPLPIGSRAGRWVDMILPVLHSNSQCEHAATPAVATPAQLDLIS